MQEEITTQTSRGTNKKSCADERKRKGTSRKVPQFGQGSSGSAPPEWLGTSHMSVLGACWAQAYFEKEGYFGRRPIFGEKVYFGKDLILERRPNFGAHAIDGKKETCRKRRKRNMQEEKQHVAHIGRKS
jgi:hypothetical protein